MPDLFVAKKEEIQEAIHKIEEKIHDPSKVVLLSTYVSNPSNISFHHREKDEDILLFLRGHLITNLKWVLITLAFGVLPFIVLALGLDNLAFPAIQRDFVTIFVLIYYLCLFAFAFSNFLTWYFNIFVITKNRVIDIDFAGLIFHDVAETQFTLLQDVNYTQSGPLRHFLNFGDVYAQTAGGKENLEAMGVPRPSEVTTFITKHMGRKNGNI